MWSKNCAIWFVFLVLSGLRWSKIIFGQLRSSEVFLGHLSFERSSSMPYVGLGWDGYHMS